MGNNKAGSAAAQIDHGLLQQHLCSRVDAAGRLVENQDGRPRQDRTGNGDQLALSLAEPAARFAQLRIKAIRQTADKGVRADDDCGLLDFLIAGIQTAIADIFPYRTAK